MQTNNAANQYLAEGETPAGVTVIVVGSNPAASQEEEGGEPPDDVADLPTRLARFVCANRLGAKVEDTPWGAILLESAA